MHNCQSTGSIQTALFSFTFLKTVKYQVCAKGQDWCKQNKMDFNWSLSISSSVSTSPDVYFNIVNIMQKEMLLQVNFKIDKNDFAIKCFPALATSTNRR